MMNYELFKDIVEEQFLGYLPEEFQNAEVSIGTVDKVNLKKDGLTLHTEGDGALISPTIYLNDMYADYQKTDDFNKVMEQAADTMMRAMDTKEIVIPELNYENAKDNIVFQLINTEQNKEMLETTPHRQFHDLSIIYRWVMNVDGVGGIQSAVVHEGLQRQLDLTEEQLFKLAVENTKRLFPPTVKSMTDVLKEMFVRDGMPEEMFSMVIPEDCADREMYVIGNEKGINGAASMLYEETLHELAEKFGTDLYILPSSLHECIAVSSEMGDPYELAQMVVEVNMQQVELDERLSNQVYHYDKDLRKLSLATDTPNKRLDGIVAESTPEYNAKNQLR